MKTVDLETLKQQLKEARNGGRKQQKAFLSSINHHSTNGIVINEMNDSDLQWIAPLALELFVPAVNLVACGMRQKCRHWEEDFLDDDTGETVTVLRTDVIDGETVFTPNDELLDRIGKNIIASFNRLDNEKLRDLMFWCVSPEVKDAIDDELYRRDDPVAISNRGVLYQYGDEANGIFIDYDKAKTYYDRAGEEFDPVETARQCRYDAEHTDYPEFTYYRIAGDDVPAVKALLTELYKKYGEHTEPFWYLPLEVVMKSLVGSDAYVGYIQSIHEGDPCEIPVEFYEANRDCLKYALLQVFPNLTIEVIDQD